MARPVRAIDESGPRASSGYGNLSGQLDVNGGKNYVNVNMQICKSFL
jgi:hypothetical protein